MSQARAPDLCFSGTFDVTGGNGDGTANGVDAQATINGTSFTADGGGDGPEHVNKALHDAINEINWSDDDATLKIVFLVGDATLATFPANSSPRYATNVHISFASLSHLITQVSWVKPIKNASVKK